MSQTHSQTNTRPAIAALLLPLLLPLIVACEPVSAPEISEKNAALLANGGGLAIENEKLDVLFIVDNSGSMGEEQAVLASSVDALLDSLEASVVPIDYHLGVTTTDNGNPWCPPGQTTPEAGDLVMTPCAERLEEFLFGVPGDVSDLACTDICNLDAGALEIQPSAIFPGMSPPGELAPRPWLEKIGGVTNLPPATDIRAALDCYLPQGINGCGFEAQLESMYLALLRAQDPEDPTYGFLRPDASLLIVFVTDEADGSYNKDFAEIWDADGSKTFWSGNASFPTSAVGWNAGVSCVGDPLWCDPVNKDVNGNEAVSDEEAVMYPMSRYTQALTGLQQAKQDLGPNHHVYVSLIGGVSNQGEAFYAMWPPSWVDSFGIGPGCMGVRDGVPVEAVPPVRIRDLVEAFSPGHMYSICAPTFTDAFESLGAAVSEDLAGLSGCYLDCVDDCDRSSPGLDPYCVVQETQPGWSFPELLEACSAMVSEPCYVFKTHDMSTACAATHYNLEVEIQRTDPAPPGTVVDVVCATSSAPHIDCPLLDE